jgi:hypothetical protein
MIVRSWLRRGSGNYFIDCETGKTGHAVSMFPGIQVYQVFPSEPEKKKWFIVYGATAASKIDFYDLETDTQTTFNGVLEAELFRFPENKILAHLITAV